MPFQTSVDKSWRCHSANGAPNVLHFGGGERRVCFLHSQIYAKASRTAAPRRLGAPSMATVSSLTWVGKARTTHPGAPSIRSFIAWVGKHKSDPSSASSRATKRRQSSRVCHPERSGWGPLDTGVQGASGVEGSAFVLRFAPPKFCFGPGSPLLCPRVARSLRIRARFPAAQRAGNPLPSVIV